MGTSFSDLHAVVQAWQPMHLDWSMTFPHKGRVEAPGPGVGIGSGASKGGGSLANAAADEVADAGQGRVADRVEGVRPRSAAAHQARRHEPREVLRDVRHRQPCPVGKGPGAQLALVVEGAQDPEPVDVAEEAEAAGGLLQELIWDHLRTRYVYQGLRSCARD